jgi:hypothetical protein
MKTLPPKQSAMKTREKKVRRLLLTQLALAGMAFLLAGAVEARPKARLVHVFVALADNANQGIVRVPAAIGNGEDPARNLYWGATYGVRAYFRKSADWKEVAATQPQGSPVLERSVFAHRAGGVYLIADAYRGKEIRQTLRDFFRAAAGLDPQIDIPQIDMAASKVSLAVYIGHDELMEAGAQDALALATQGFQSAGPDKRDAIMLACASKRFFAPLLRPTGAQPLLWTTDLMAPEAYTLKAALDGWIAGEEPEQIRTRAAAAYAKYQKIGLKGARGLFASGW